MTSVNIFQRYTIHHNLTSLVAKAGGYISWPFPPAETDYVHIPGERYDVLFNHMVYNKTWLRSKFPANTAYISLIREPLGHLKSCMRFYSLPQLLRITSTNPIKSFLRDPWRYKTLSEAYFRFCNVTWDGTRNHLAFDMGYPTEGAEDMEAAERYIKGLEYDFTLVLLLEHLDESFVLLRRLMCWEMQDVLYDTVPRNVGNYSYKSYTPTPRELANLRRWKAVDYLLYDTFNRSLWRKIAAQGPNFYQELYYYRELKRNVSFYCHGEQKRKPNRTLTVEATKWSPQFVVDAEYCRIMQTTAWNLTEEIRQKASRKEEGRWLIIRPVLNLRSIIKGQPTFKYKMEQIKYERKLQMERKHSKHVVKKRGPKRRHFGTTHI
ncbi:galactose-3-O-sulfotransferase 3-like [Branchiostoma lanceolatum]|uniref:galactose-3-O-sulfotransferase 3-like n=1 Tax=Branchiostoma lanceolatum TaxID=7740 RepID=UPI003456395F